MGKGGLLWDTFLKIFSKKMQERLDFGFLILIFVQTISGTCPKLGQLSARHSEIASLQRHANAQGLRGYLVCYARTI
jgi:hypothetical protein